MWGGGRQNSNSNGMQSSLDVASLDVASLDGWISQASQMANITNSLNNGSLAINQVMVFRL
jgi:hypothetical protein